MYGVGIKKNIIKKFIIYLLISYLSIFSYKLVFLTEGQKNEIYKYSLFKKLFINKSIVIPNFIKSNNILIKKQINNDIKNNILFSGKYTELKGFHHFIELNKLLPEYKFFCMGDERKINYRNITNYGIVNHSDINLYYDKCSILILPSYTEVFPLTILEAMARGLVILVSNIPGLKEIITENRNGYFFELGNTKKIINILNYLKNNTKELTRISNNNLNDIKRFDSHKILNKYKKIYV